MGNAKHVQIIERVRRIPIFATLGFSEMAIGDASFEAVVPHDPRYDGIFESFHGGILMTIADSAAAVAVLAATSPDERIVTTDMSIRLLTPARSPVRVHAEAVKVGRTLVPVSARLFDDRLTLIALAQVTYMRLRN
jgi:uncharacterized protein (TIGR00369 family)